MRYALVFSVTITALALSTAHAQQRGWYWDGYDWRWQGYGPITRPKPPGSAYKPQSREPDIYDVWRQWGGRPRYCTDKWGNTFVCGQ